MSTARTEIAPPPGDTTSPFVAGLAPEVSRELREAMTPHRLRGGQVLFEQDAEGASLFVVETGRLKVSRATPAGRARILALLGPGSLFGEMSLLDDLPRDATVTAVTETTVLELAQTDFDALLSAHPEITGALLALMGRRLRDSNEVVSDLVFADVPSRVARLLLRLSDQLGEELPDGGVRIDHGLTQDELAQCVGAARETVNKALAQLAGEGWIEVRLRSITVHQPQPLRDLTA